MQRTQSLVLWQVQGLDADAAVSRDWEEGPHAFPKTVNQVKAFVNKKISRVEICFFYLMCRGEVK